jgi:iron complex transport system substrate-binding protein
MALRDSLFNTYSIGGRRRIANLTRRQFVSGAVAAALLVACGKDDETSTQSGGGSMAASSSGSFPLTISHKYGSTTIPREPTKVVSVGFQDHDTILALGVTPLAVREWWGEQPFATWPWARDELGDATPVVLEAKELDFERIASLAPDLIVGLYSGITEDEYRLLSGIASTVTQPEEFIDYGMPWRDQTLVTGRVLGKEELAQSRVAEVERLFEAARQQNPRFKDATFVIAGPTGDGSYWLYGQDDPRSRLLRDLGFVIPPELANLAGNKFSGTFSAEQARLLDVDVLLWLTETEDDKQTLTNDALYQRLSVVQEGRAIVLSWEAPLTGALSFSSVLSLPFALEQLVPELAAARAKVR